MKNLGQNHHCHAPQLIERKIEKGWYMILIQVQQSTEERKRRQQEEVSTALCKTKVCLKKAFNLHNIGSCTVHSNIM